MKPVKISWKSPIMLWYRVSRGWFGLYPVLGTFCTPAPIVSDPATTCTIGRWCLLSPITLLGAVPAILIGALMALIVAIIIILALLLGNTLVSIYEIGGKSEHKIPLYFTRRGKPVEFMGRKVAVVPVLLWIGILGYFSPLILRGVVGALKGIWSLILMTVTGVWSGLTWLAIGIWDGATWLFSNEFALAIVAGLAFLSLVIWGLVVFFRALRDPERALGATWRSVVDKTCRKVLVVR